MRFKTAPGVRRCRQPWRTYSLEQYVHARRQKFSLGTVPSGCTKATTDRVLLIYCPFTTVSALQAPFYQQFLIHRRFSRAVKKLQLRLNAMLSCCAFLSYKICSYNKRAMTSKLATLALVLISKALSVRISEHLGGLLSRVSTLHSPDKDYRWPQTFFLIPRTCNGVATICFGSVRRGFQGCCFTCRKY